MSVVGLSACFWVVLGALVAAQAGALPPAAAVSGSLSKPHWLTHRVIPGDQLRRIAEHYGVTLEQLLEWNELPKQHARIRAGDDLRVRSIQPALVRKRQVYRVRVGDSWTRIARKHRISQRDLRRWNRTSEEDLRPDDKIILWLAAAPSKPERDVAPASIERDESAKRTARDGEKKQPRKAESNPAESNPAEPDSPEAETATTQTPFPVVSVSQQSQSVGRPGRGRIRRPVQLPVNDALYRRRDPSHSYASSHTIMVLQQSIARFRSETGYAGEIVFNDLSRRGGGKLSPHRSHQSGRDADIRLPLVPGTEQDNGTGTLDWDATWALMRAMIDTGQVRYIFLSRHRQRHLRKAAQRAGTAEDELAKLLQFPGYERTAVIRHSPGHDQHFHIRIACGPDEGLCHE